MWLHEFDDHYYDARGTRSLPVLRVRFRDADTTWLYLDPARGGIALKTDETRRLRRWLYQGLHSLDFPFLYYERPLWDVVVIVLCFFSRRRKSCKHNGLRRRVRFVPTDDPTSTGG